MDLVIDYSAGWESRFCFYSPCKFPPCPAWALCTPSPRPASYTWSSSNVPLTCFFWFSKHIPGMCVLHGPRERRLDRHSRPPRSSSKLFLVVPIPQTDLQPPRCIRELPRAKCEWNRIMFSAGRSFSVLEKEQPTPVTGSQKIMEETCSGRRLGGKNTYCTLYELTYVYILHMHMCTYINISAMYLYIL